MNEARYRAAERDFWSAHGLEPTERFVRLASTRTRVRVLEVGEGAPALFIHGGPNAGSTWAPIVERLQGLRCLMVDRPGTGLSEPYPVRAHNVAEFGSRFVAEVLDGLGIDRAHVVASSFGGHIALRSASHDSARFDRMVQMACPALVPGETYPPFMKLISNPVMRRIATLMPPSRKMGESILRQIGHGASLDAGRISEAFADWSMALQRYTDTNRNDFEMIASAIRHRDDVRLDAHLLAAVEVPTRFLWGADDTFGDEAVARSLAAMMPDADVEMIPEAGHLPWLDVPAELARKTMAFLAEGRRRAPGGGAVGAASGGTAAGEHATAPVAGPAAASARGRASREARR